MFPVILVGMDQFYDKIYITIQYNNLVSKGIWASKLFGQSDRDPRRPGVLPRCQGEV